MSYSRAVTGPRTRGFMLNSIHSTAEVELGHKLSTLEVSKLSEKFSVSHIYEITEKYGFGSLKFLQFLCSNPHLKCKFSPTVTPRDGNCLLHAISDGILNNDAFRHTEGGTDRWTELLKELKYYEEDMDAAQHIQFLRNRWVLGASEWLAGKNGSKENDKETLNYTDEEWSYVWATMIEDGAWAVPSIKDGDGNFLKPNQAPELFIKYIAHDLLCNIIVFDLYNNTVEFCSGNHLLDNNVKFSSPLLLYTTGSHFQSIFPEDPDFFVQYAMDLQSKYFISQVSPEGELTNEFERPISQKTEPNHEPIPSMADHHNVSNHGNKDGKGIDPVTADQKVAQKKIKLNLPTVRKSKRLKDDEERHLIKKSKNESMRNSLSELANLPSDTDNIEKRLEELKKIKANERSSSEKKEIERLRKAASRAAKTPEDKKKNLEQRHEQEHLRRESLSPAAREKELERKRKKENTRQASLSPSSREKKRQKDRLGPADREKKRRREQTRYAGLSPDARIKKIETIRAKKDAESYAKSKTKTFIGWTSPGEKNMVSTAVIEKMNEICVDCGALMFPWEAKKKKKKEDMVYTFSLCCSYGTIKLNNFRDPPPQLSILYMDPGAQCRQFRENIRLYNGMVSMASRNITGAMTNFANTRGPNIFKMSGQMYHLTPSHMFPKDEKQPKFSQIYVYDQNNETDNRLTHAQDKKKVNIDTLKIIQNELKKVNFFVQQFMSAAQVFEANPKKNLKLVFKAKGSKGAKKKHMNPEISDVVVIAPGEQTQPRDVVLYRHKDEHPKQNETTRINENHIMYDPTAYPLILPFGDYGFSIDREIFKTNGRKVTAMEFYRYHLQVRDDSFNALHRACRLGQEYLCDQYSKIEASRLKFLRENQDQLRVDLYSGLQDALAKAKADKSGKSEEAKIGQMIVLPSSYTGSPRWMYSHYLDALAIARKYKKFTLFITMTGNSNWSGVKENLFEGQQPFNRPDVMNRIFQRMLGLLLEDLKKGALGPLKARLHTIEGQFRCLKHAHILLLLTITLTVDDIDKIISAQIPDQEQKPELYTAVSKYMLHGPCGLPAFPSSPCMEKGMCSKGYPKQFREKTTLPDGGHGYPLYARPDNGRTIEKNGFKFDNRWVVPHNEFLSVKFNCHINVEFIGSFQTIKYIYKYVHKGTDVSTVALGTEDDKDEIRQFVNARTIDPYDAHWRIQGYKVQDRDPAVMKLAIHTEDQQTVCFRDGKAEKALENSKSTTLMAYFELNQEDEDAHSIKYQDIPEYYTWDDRQHTWNKRKRQPVDGEVPRTIGRISNVLPIQGERFYLRLLLNHITGARSFSDMKILNGRTYETYKEVCLEMGLLEDDSEWVTSMTEVSQYGSPHQIRATLAIILQYCQPTKPIDLFETFLSSMSDDFIYKMLKESHKDTLDEDDMDDVKNNVLRALDTELGQMGGSLANFPDLPSPPPMTENEEMARIMKEEIFNKKTQENIVQQLEPLLNHDQTNLCEAVYQAVHAAQGEKIQKLFIMNSPGGYGKTFTFKLITAKIRSEGRIVLCVASTGLAAQNLEGGRTAHSRFKIPIPVLEDSTCSIPAQSALAKLIQKADMIIWDEIFSCDRHNLECVERTLRDLMNSKELFGGKVVCLGGDPRQTLPVVRRGSRAQIVRACVQMSPLYVHFKEFKLSQNMRTDKTEIEFSKYILKLGEGDVEIVEEINENCVQIPDKFLVQDRNTMIENVFPNLEIEGADSLTLIEGTIYTPLNKNMKYINDICLARFAGEDRTYLSHDTIMQEDQKDSIPNEFLNSLTPSGMPDNELVLKLGAPVMLLRNLQAGPSCSLRNGTRMIVKQLLDRTVECQVAVGTDKGTRVFLPRIPIYDRSNEFPFTLVRRQFPLRLAFAVTINKGQGQENERVGIYLPEPVFAHGQLYTAFSRGKRADNVWVCIEDNKKGFTDNIVYKELL